ncbi:hypothetical protein KEM60_00216 [Austwickia sp. TVS 96-490-7B]|uniref:hypothetical protein n=1 Tax=Austwickia sp. TVS 96-490-7B TaxID=2830843 RepID=UPI001C56CDCF|nr:hypothetical protein [Austwickia sp. TVS 96-490-7B]MBW3084033.1 hypothetical protein [Austwickia sp. TVS 96-490-7B]
MLISAATGPAVGEGTPTVADPIFANHLRIADFAAALSQRLLAETRTNSEAPDDEYLRGYARAMSDFSEALTAGDMCPGGMFCPEKQAS